MGDDGFSLIELMVALLVLAILLAIAIPTFLGTTAVANDRSAQANLNTAMTDAKAQFQSNGQSFYVNSVQNSAAFAGLLTAAQLSLTFGTGNSASSSSVSVAVSVDGNGLVMAAYSVPGDCYYVVDNTGGINAASKAVAPYSGGSGTIALPTVPGVSYGAVLGDTSPADCNAGTPKTSGSPATVQFRTSGFPY